MEHLQIIRNKVYNGTLDEEKNMLYSILEQLIPEVLQQIQTHKLKVFIGGSLPMMCISGASQETILENLGDIDLYPESYAIMMACLGPIENEKCQVIPHKFKSFEHDVLGTYDSTMIMIGFDLKNKTFVYHKDFLNSLHRGVFDYILRTTSPDMHQARFNKLLERAEIFFNTTLEEFNADTVLIPDSYLRCPKSFQQASYLEYFCGMVQCIACKNLNYLALCSKCSAHISGISPSLRNQMIQESCLVIGNGSLADKLYQQVQGRYGQQTEQYNGSDIVEMVRYIANHRNIFLIIDVRPQMLEINKINDQKIRVSKILELVREQSEFLNQIFDEYLMFKNNELQHIHELHIIYSAVTGYDPNQKLEYQLQNSTLHNSIEIRAGLLFTNRLAITLTIVPYLSDMTELDKSISYIDLTKIQNDSEVAKFIRAKKSEGADTSYIHMINTEHYLRELRKVFKIKNSLYQIESNIRDNDKYVLYVKNIFFHGHNTYFEEA